MNEITIVGVDLAKEVIVACAADAQGWTRYFKQLSFEGFARWAATLPACTFGMLAAVRQPHMRFVSVKSVDQQAMLAWHRARSGLKRCTPCQIPRPASGSKFVFRTVRNREVSPGASKDGSTAFRKTNIDPRFQGSPVFLNPGAIGCNAARAPARIYA